MGRDKAGLPVENRTLAEVIARTVHTVAGRTALVGGERRTALEEFGFVPDLYPGEGPLGGILAALADTTSDWNLVVACDMPRLRADFLGALLDEAESRDGDVLLPAGPAGRPEPLCAVYHRRSRAGLQGAFDRGVRKIAKALEEVRAILWSVPEVACFQNVNTPEEWAAYDR